jgi:hypothetical protein
MTYDHIEPAERDGVAFAQLRAAPRYLAKLAERIAQRVFVLLATINRSQRLASWPERQVRLPAE